MNTLVQTIYEYIPMFFKCKEINLCRIELHNAFFQTLTLRLGHCSMHLCRKLKLPEKAFSSVFYTPFLLQFWKRIRSSEANHVETVKYLFISCCEEEANIFVCIYKVSNKLYFWQHLGIAAWYMCVRNIFRLAKDALLEFTTISTLSLSNTSLQFPSRP